MGLLPRPWRRDVPPYSGSASGWETGREGGAVLPGPKRRRRTGRRTVRLPYAPRAWLRPLPVFACAWACVRSWGHESSCSRIPHSAREIALRALHGDGDPRESREHARVALVKLLPNSHHQKKPREGTIRHALHAACSPNMRVRSRDCMHSACWSALLSE